MVYTGAVATRASLKVATELARDLAAKLELLVPFVVPFPLPLDRPSIPRTFTENAVSALVSNCPVDFEVKVLLCRDREETIPRWLPANSIAVIGRSRHWGPESYRGIIRAVRQKGHHVIVVDEDGQRAAHVPAFKRWESR